MLKLLLPIDDTDSTPTMLDSFLAWLDRLGSPAEIHLLNVQPLIHGDVGRFISENEIRDFHLEQGLKVLEPYKEKLLQKGIPHQFHVSVGDPAEVIVQFAREQQCDQIVMGTRRALGPLMALLSGSVTTKVIESSDLPVMLIK